MPPLVAAVLLALPAAAAAAPDVPETRTRIPGGLHTLVTDADYPEEALLNDEEGTVGFRLDVGTDGSVTGCTVTASSGSASLDAATCRIMADRGRFEPARDARGKPTPDQVNSRLTWRIEGDHLSSRQQVASSMWSTCVLGEASKLVIGNLSPAEVTARSFPPCEALETLLARELGAQTPLVELRESLTAMMEEQIPQVRSTFGTPAPPAPAAPDPQR